MNLTGQIDTWRIHLVLEGIFICVKLMLLILLSLALGLTPVKFLLLELHFLGDLEQAETIGNEGRVEGKSMLFCYIPYSVSKIGRQEHKAHTQYRTAPETCRSCTLLLWWSYLNHEGCDKSSPFGTPVFLNYCEEQKMVNVLSLVEMAYDKLMLQISKWCLRSGHWEEDEKADFLCRKEYPNSAQFLK